MRTHFSVNAAYHLLILYFIKYDAKTFSNLFYFKVKYEQYHSVNMTYMNVHEV